MAASWLTEAMNISDAKEEDNIDVDVSSAFSVNWTVAPSENQVYLRNNKSDCSKRLRCFPTCCSDGHATKSFCGNEISAIVSSPLLITQADIDSEIVVALGEIYEVEDTNLAFMRLLNPDGLTEDYLRYFSSRNLPRAEHIFKGKIQLRPAMTVTTSVLSSSGAGPTRSKLYHYRVSFQPACWPYDWSAPKHGNCLHTFVLSLFYRDGCLPRLPGPGQDVILPGQQDLTAVLATALPGAPGLPRLSYKIQLQATGDSHPLEGPFHTQLDSLGILPHPSAVSRSAIALAGLLQPLSQPVHVIDIPLPPPVTWNGPGAPPSHSSPSVARYSSSSISSSFSSPYPVNRVSIGKLLSLAGSSLHTTGIYARNLALAAAVEGDAAATAAGGAGGGVGDAPVIRGPPSLFDMYLPIVPRYRHLWHARTPMFSLASSRRGKGMVLPSSSTERPSEAARKQKAAAVGAALKKSNTPIPTPMPMPQASDVLYEISQAVLSGQLPFPEPPSLPALLPPPLPALILSSAPVHGVPAKPAKKADAAVVGWKKGIHSHAIPVSAGAAVAGEGEGVGGGPSACETVELIAGTHLLKQEENGPEGESVSMGFGEIYDNGYGYSNTAKKRQRLQSDKAKPPSASPSPSYSAAQSPSYSAAQSSSPSAYTPSPFFEAATIAEEDSPAGASAQEIVFGSDSGSGAGNGAGKHRVNMPDPETIASAKRGRWLSRKTASLASRARMLEMNQGYRQQFNTGAESACAELLLDMRMQPVDGAVEVQGQEQPKVSPNRSATQPSPNKAPSPSQAQANAATPVYERVRNLLANTCGPDQVMSPASLADGFRQHLLDTSAEREEGLRKLMANIRQPGEVQRLEASQLLLHLRSGAEVKDTSSESAATTKAANKAKAAAAAAAAAAAVAPAPVDGGITGVSMDVQVQKVSTAPLPAAPRTQTELESDWHQQLGMEVREAGCRLLYNGLQTGARARWGGTVVEPSTNADGNTVLTMMHVNVTNGLMAENATDANTVNAQTQTVNHLYIGEAAHAALSDL